MSIRAAYEALRYELAMVHADAGQRNEPNDSDWDFADLDMNTMSAAHLIGSLAEHDPTEDPET